MSVTVYSKENCVQCNSTYRFLEKNSVDFKVSELNDSILNKYPNFWQAPIVVVQNGIEEDSWCGFRPDKIKALAPQMVAM
ncbi:glutaredoxin-like protein NrdH [Actinomycetota bacterium]|nr:glutaredoxin-like protein NrdH [Actinomycetota bacterium]